MARARFEATAEPGVYRLSLPDPPGGFAYATVARRRPRGDDPAPLEPAEAARLAEGWPLGFEPDTPRLSARMLSAGGPAAAANSGAAWSSPPSAASASRST